MPTRPVLVMDPIYIIGDPNTEESGSGEGSYEPLTPAEMFDYDQPGAYAPPEVSKAPLILGLIAAGGLIWWWLR